LVDNKVSGTLIWYFFICTRETWLMAHQINAFQDNHFLELGRFLSKETYDRQKKEIAIENLKIDIIKKASEQIIIGEIKKSSKFLESATMQLCFYLYRLKKLGVEARGELLIPKEKKRYAIVLDEEKENELKRAFRQIDKIIEQSLPPPPKRTTFCSKCAYSEFCWS